MELVYQFVCERVVVVYRASSGLWKWWEKICWSIKQSTDFHTNWYTNSSSRICMLLILLRTSHIREVISVIMERLIVSLNGIEESCSGSPSDGMVRILYRDENMDSDIVYMKLYSHCWSWSVSRTSANSITHCHKCYLVVELKSLSVWWVWKQWMCISIHMVLNELKYQSGQSSSSNWKRGDEWMNGLLS